MLLFSPATALKKESIHIMSVLGLPSFIHQGIGFFCVCVPSAIFFFKDAVELLPVLLAPEGTVLDTYHAGGLGK